jgi:GDPmannose 4,6-dehydratase
MTNRVAIIVGSSGQDGQLLDSHLRALGYSVIGLTRHNIDILCANNINKFVSESQPDEVYYLAAYHHSSEDKSVENADLFHNSFDIHVRGLVNFLDAIAKYSAKSRLFYASSSLIFGIPQDEIQTEDSKLNPSNPYAISKVAGMMACRFYREHKSIFAASGILYNHESSLRSPRFVTRKIVQAAVNIYRSGHGSLRLGNLDSKVDWGYAPDYVDAMYRILQIAVPQDFVIATGVGHTVREFASLAFARLGLDYRDYVISTPEILMRNGPLRLGNSSLLRDKTGWAPKTSFEDMMAIMVDSELKLTERSVV